MGAVVVTVVDTTVDPSQETDLVEGFRALVAGGLPEGLIRSDLLRGQGGAWRIQSTWRDREAIAALRAAGTGHAAAQLLEGLGLVPAQAVFTLEVGSDS
jgi:quinol monooxygenase YgiN